VAGDLLPAVLGLRPAGPSRVALSARLRGRVVVVTGASRGIGAETSARFALAGARLVLLARDAGALERVAAGIRRRGGSALVIAADLRDPDAAGAAGDRILAEAGVPELVVSNAGHSIRRRLLDYAGRPHDVSRTIGVNYVGPVALLQTLVPAMVDAGRGHIVSIGSTSVDIPAPGWSVYGASKTAFDAWLRAVAPELAPHGIAVTSIHLPLVRTAMSAPTYGAGSPAMRPVDAAKLIARAVVERPRLISPWWSRLAGGVLVAFPGLSDRVVLAYERALDRQSLDRQSRDRA
jgi:NAD(P)-dependent dehydrogenase (short-subunit alcohol dehydrogenase family)